MIGEVVGTALMWGAVLALAPVTGWIEAAHRRGMARLHRDNARSHHDDDTRRAA